MSRHSPYESGKVVSPTDRPPLPATEYTWYSFPLGAESTRYRLASCAVRQQTTPRTWGSSSSSSSSSGGSGGGGSSSSSSSTSGSSSSSSQ